MEQQAPQQWLLSTRLAHRTVVGQVAENMRVWRSARVLPAMARMWGSKPRSSMRSASSSTRKLTSSSLQGAARSATSQAGEGAACHATARPATGARSPIPSSSALCDTKALVLTCRRRRSSGPPAARAWPPRWPPPCAAPAPGRAWAHRRTRRPCCSSGRGTQDQTGVKQEAFTDMSKHNLCGA